MVIKIRREKRHNTDIEDRETERIRKRREKEETMLMIERQMNS